MSKLIEASAYFKQRLRSDIFQVPHNATRDEVQAMLEKFYAKLLEIDWQDYDPKEGK